MNTLTRLALTLAMALPVGAALAQTTLTEPTDTSAAVRHRGKQLQLLDTDQDGRLSRAEVNQRGGLTHSFDQIDANHDGFLDATELRQWAATHPVTHGKGKGKHEGKYFAQHDLNKDGVITSDEASKMGKGGQFFQQADANGDGKVTPQEAHAFRKTHRPAKKPAPVPAPASGPAPVTQPLTPAPQ